ncbi:hypothetical protein FVE85_6986 [Porphyridium purpureum]|uniref:Uncharacterized protein n=1 Tax=Porphyridium purpureum TaxID=35688 RepID=A0A5J4Z6B7_PORPP|nr:hypothetical protein FVE85_6986 [Porphyridium purpureum]|eukprot:POR6751..scf295_1
MQKSLKPRCFLYQNNHVLLYKTRFQASASANALCNPRTSVLTAPSTRSEEPYATPHPTSKTPVTYTYCTAGSSVIARPAAAALSRTVSPSRATLPKRSRAAAEVPRVTAEAAQQESAVDRGVEHAQQNSAGLSTAACLLNDAVQHAPVAGTSDAGDSSRSESSDEALRCPFPACLFRAAREASMVRHATSATAARITQSRRTLAAERDSLQTRVEHGMRSAALRTLGTSTAHAACSARRPTPTVPQWAVPAAKSLPLPHFRRSTL